MDTGNNLKKRLVFYFYAVDGWEDIITNKIHMECLRRFKDVFDEAVITIAVDDIDNRELIRSVEQAFIDIKVNYDILFKITTNNRNLREAVTFKKEVADKIETDDEWITFFGHNKGTTNEHGRNLWIWIVELWYMCLGIEDVMDFFAFDPNHIAFGPLIIEDKWVMDYKYDNPYGLIYAGTFFWTFNAKVSVYMKMRGITLPPLNDRWYGENFFGQLVGNEVKWLGTHGLRFIPKSVSLSPYDSMEEMLNMVFSEDDKERFYNFYNNVMKNIGIDEKSNSDSLQ